MSRTRAEDPPYIGHLRWPEGRAHEALNLVLLERPDGKAKVLRYGPVQGKAEYLRHHTGRTVVFLVAVNEQNDQDYIVVPGYKVDHAPYDDHGVPTVRVVRVQQWEQGEILLALKAVLKPRGLEHAPVNFWF